MSQPTRQEPRIHLICNAHLDPVWQWPWEEGLTEALSTFETACELLDEYPEFIFNHNESLLYEWILEYQPPLFERIRKHVQSGRWRIAGGWYLQPDCNIPCGESFIRHGLYGRRFFSEHFKVTPKVAYNLDPFGHHANMPQILKKMGFEMYVHFRPTEAECDLPYPLYRWRGIDGSEIIGHRPTVGFYNTGTLQDFREKAERLVADAKKTNRELTLFWGAGDHGGGATRQDLDQIRLLQQEKLPQIQHSGFDEWLETAREEAADAPIHQGEIQKCLPGCYTSAIKTKLLNRKAEGLALAAERWAAIAWWKLKTPYPREAIDAVWKNTLFNQFHDILPGTSVREGMERAQEIYGEAASQARRIILKSQLALLASTKRRASLPLICFNPIAKPRQAPIETEFMTALHPHRFQGKGFRVLNAKNQEIPIQRLTPQPDTPMLGDINVSSDQHWRTRIAFIADLPALGMAQYQIEEIPGEQPTSTPDKNLQKNARCFTFSNDHFSLAINHKTGLLESLKDKSSQKEFLKSPGAAIHICQDSSDCWGFGMIKYGKKLGLFRPPNKKQMHDILSQPEQSLNNPVRIIESGPILTRIEVIQAWNRSTARIRYTLWPSRPEIQIEILLNWNERRRMARLVFPTTMDQNHYIVEVPHGAIKRKGQLGEMPCGRWTMLTANDNKTAFALINNGTSGVDVHKATLNQSLLRSPVYCSSEKTARPHILRDHMDLGEHHYTFHLRFGNTQAVRQSLPEISDTLMLPTHQHIHIPQAPVPHEKKGLSSNHNILSIKGTGIHLSALKQSEDQTALTVRLVETTGEPQVGTLTLHAPHITQRYSFQPYEIKTIQIIPTSTVPTFHERNLLENTTD